MKLLSISPSRIKTFDRCLFKYWLTYHGKIAMRSNFGAVHGSMLHDICEFYVTGEDKDWLKRLFEAYAGTLKTRDKYGKEICADSPLLLAKEADYKNQKPKCDICPYVTENGTCQISGENLNALNGCPKKLFETSVSTMRQVIESYEESTWPLVLKDNTGKVIGAEYELNITLEGTNIPLIGIMDLVIERDPETIEIIDYKFGNWTQNYDECREDIQVKIYSMAARKEFVDDVHNKGHKYKNIFLTFDYFTGSPVTIAYTKEEDKATESYVINKMREILSTNKITRVIGNKSFDWQCKSMCDINVCKREWKGEFEV